MGKTEDPVYLGAFEVHEWEEGTCGYPGCSKVVRAETYDAMAARVKELEDDKSHLLGTITRMVGTEREDEAKHEAREEKLREALVKVRRIVETDSQIHSQIKVSNIVSAALGKEASREE